MVPPTNTPTDMPTNTPTDSFINLLVTGRVLDLSALIVLLMLRSIVVTNTIVLRDLAVVTNATVLRDFVQREIEAGADVRTALV
jgi:multidrug efflux pump subunit AcrB